MSLRKVKDIYYYEFMFQGKRYRGTCICKKTGKGLSDKKEAAKYEAEMKASVKNIRSKNKVKVLVEEYRDELTASAPIELAEAFELSLKKPKQREPSKELIDMKRSYWNDFLSYMNSKHPDVKTLANIQRSHATEYIQYLRSKGRFQKTLKYKRGKEELKYKLKGDLSAKTINTFHQTLTEVFQLLTYDAGLIENPFLAIPKLKKETESREAFTEAELRKINKKLDDFSRPLFTIAISTALREGDICTLKWEEVDFEDGVIYRSQMRKTGHAVEIPMMPPLHEYLSKLKSESVLRPEDEYTEYVLPMHAQMYLTNRTGVSYRIKSFLESCEIKTTKIPKGRTRAISVKDLHSCRHTFCYYAGLYGIPMNIVQGIVGHMTPEMTKHYSAHASLEAKREKMKLLPDFMSMPVNGNPPAVTLSERERLNQMINQLV